MLTVFWDSQCLLLEHYQQQCSTINSTHYREMLNDRLKPAIRSKQQRLLSKGTVSLNDNARPHTAAHTVETLQTFKPEVLTHPAHNPDLTPSNYHLFGPLKVALKGRRFTLDQELKEVVHAWLIAQLKMFFLKV